MKAPKKLVVPADPAATLEQRFFYRIQEYLADRRSIDAEFTLPGLRGWMLSQKWPDPPSEKLECLAVLSWTAICQVESSPDEEDEIRRELGRQLDYLDGSSSLRPATLDTLLSADGRTEAYTSLRRAAEPGSSRREYWGLPRYNAAERES